MTGARLTRRRLLAGLSTIGFASGIVAFAVDSDERVTLAQVGPFDLQVEWSERVQGSQVESSDDFEGDINEDDPPPGIIDVSDVKPGDQGTLTTRVELDAVEPEAPDQSAAISLFFEEVSGLTSDNSPSEPENAVDGAVDDGELAENVDVEVWYDADCTGDLDPAELPLVVDDTLDQVIGTQVQIDPSPGDGTTDCFTTGDQVCLSIRWSLDFDAVGNVVQTDSAGFTIGFGAEACNGGGG